MKRFLVVLVLAVGVANVAAAQDPSIPFAPEDKRGTAWLEVGGYGRGGPAVSGYTLDFTFGFGYRVMRELNLRVMMPLMFGDGDSVPRGFHDSALDSGNPFLGAEWVRAFQHVHVRIGGGVTIPLAPNNASPLFTDPLIENYAVGLHGAVDSWLYVPNTFSVVGSGRIETRRPIGGFLVLAGELAPAFMIPTGNTMGRHVHFVLQYGFTIGIQFIKQLSAGVRVYIVHDPTDGGFLDTGDPVQASLSPYFRIELGAAFFDFCVTMNLDTPYGFAFDPDKIWGLRFAGGARF